MHKGGIDPRVDDSLHHCQMLEIIVRLEESIAGEELNQDTTNAPDIARERPAETKNNLWSAIVTCRNHRRVILILESRRAKIDKADLGIEENLPLVCLAGN